jgi:hypothetical protein
MKVVAIKTSASESASCTHSYSKQYDGFDFDRCLLARWSDNELEDLGSAADSKLAFLVDPKGGRLVKEIAPYFKDILEVVQQWLQLHSRAYPTAGSIRGCLRLHRGGARR